MQIFYHLTSINNSSLALGYFDGLHQGHRVVLKNAINIAKKNNAPSVVIMFSTHPVTFLTGNVVEQILSLDEKLDILEKIGIDNVILLDFKDYMTLSAKNYLQNVLIKYFTPIAITTGFNHSFGFNKDGNSEFLRKYQNEYGYKFYEIPPFCVDERLVSCSVIRNLIHLGDFYEANKLLGYNFFLKSKVILGDRIASKLGFASANIVYPENKIKIPLGVYFVKVQINGKTYNGVLNHGFSPTLCNETKLKTEVHIINFNDNIYDKAIKILFITKIREQQKFENKEKLKAQIQRDKAFCEMYDLISMNM